MEEFLKEFTDLKNLRNEKISAFPESEIFNCIQPTFSLTYTDQLNVKTNASPWEFLILTQNDKSKFHELESEFIKIDEKLLKLYECVLNSISDQSAVNFVIPKEIFAVLLCEFGSFERMSEIQSMNFKGVGFVRNEIYTQESYLFYHECVFRAKKEAIKRNLRRVCAKLAIALKIEKFGDKNFDPKVLKINMKEKIKIKKSKKNDKLVNKKKTGKKIKTSVKKKV